MKKLHSIIVSLILCSGLILMISCGGSRLSRGDGYMEDNEYKEAISAYEEIIKDIKDDPEAADDIKDAKERIAECYFQVGMKHYKDGNTPEAVKNFNLSKNRNAYDKIIEIYHYKGHQEFQKKEYQKALDNYDIAEEASVNGEFDPPVELKESMAKAYFYMAEEEYKAKNTKKARELYEKIAANYNSDILEQYDQAQYRLFQISCANKEYEKAVDSLKVLIDKKFTFTEEDNKAFKKILDYFKKAADTAFKKKDYKGAVQILERASVLPNFDKNKQKQLRARIIYEEGKSMLGAGKLDEALEKFKQAKEVDLNIGTEVINLSKKYIKEGGTLQKKRKYQEGIDKILIARKLTGSKDIDSKYLPDAYYKYAYSQYIKREYAGSLKNMKEGLKLNKDHKKLNALFKRWDTRVNAKKKKTEAELVKYMNMVEDDYKNAVAADLVLKRYRKKTVYWQAKVVGMEESGGKSFGKFLVINKDKNINITFYGLPGTKMDAQRFAASVEEYVTKKGEAIITGKIAYIEELLGMKNIVIELLKVEFVDALE